MTNKELSRLVHWFDNHGGIVFCMFIIAVSFAVIVPLVANNRIPQACPVSYGCYRYNGYFDWNYAFKWGIVGVGATFIPLIVYGLNNLIVGGRHKLYLTSESRRELATRRRLKAEQQAHELQQAKFRILELERDTGLAPLDPFTATMVE